MLELSLPQGIHVSGDSAQICLSFNVFTNNTCAEHCPVGRYRGVVMEYNSFSSNIGTSIATKC